MKKESLTDKVSVRLKYYSMANAKKTSEEATSETVSNGTAGILNLTQKLVDIQHRLDAPKNRKNTFGNYTYRKAEDILAAAKPLLAEHKCIVTLSDTVLEVGGRVYVKATATLRDNSGEMSVDGWAREAVDKKGMDDSQITGTTSSYARKYALNGLFAIDDEDDADTDEHQRRVTPAQAAQQKQTDKKSVSTPPAETPTTPPAAKPQFMTGEQHEWLQKQVGLTETGYNEWLIARLREIKPDTVFEVSKIPYEYAKPLAAKAKEAQVVPE